MKQFAIHRGCMLIKWNSPITVHDQSYIRALAVHDHIIPYTNDGSFLFYSLKRHVHSERDASGLPHAALLEVRDILNIS